MTRLTCAALAFFCVLVVSAAFDVAHAQDAETDSPLRLEAGQLIYEEDQKFARAVGGARVSWNGRTITADEIFYDLENGILTMSPGGIVSTAEGDRYYADQLIIQDDFSAGTAARIFGFLSDNSQLFAGETILEEDASGVRQMHLDNVSYSACRCADSKAEKANGLSALTGDSLPTGLEGEDGLSWSLHADRATWDQDRGVVRYHNARLRLFGIPALFTPYISLPDPTVARRTGFLAPDIRADEYLGQFTLLRYFVNLQPNTNLELHPFLATKRGPGLGLDLERITRRERISLKGQFTRSEPQTPNGDFLNRRNRGYVFFDATSDLNKRWRSGVSIESASDKRYLREYRVDSSAAQLSQRGWLERFGRNTYLRLRTIGYQNLREESLSIATQEIRQPAVLPQADWHWFGTPKQGFYPELHASARVLNRKNLGNSRRISLRPSVRRSITTKGGHIWDGQVVVQSSAYSFSRAAFLASRGLSQSAAQASGEQHAVIVSYTSAALGWRMPLVVRRAKDADSPSSDTNRPVHLLEPRIQLVTVAGSPEREDIPNEESQSLSLDRARLFRINRYPGSDRSEQGSRIDYGASWTSRLSEQRSLSTFLGQSTYLNKYRKEKLRHAGFAQKRTDWVTTFNAEWDHWFALDSVLRFDEESPRINLHDSELRVGREDSLHATLGYFYGLERPPPEDLAHREEVNLRFSLPLVENLSSELGIIRDTAANQTRRVENVFVYEDDCLRLDLGFFQKYTGTPENIEVDRGIFFVIDLKPLLGARAD